MQEVVQSWVCFEKIWSHMYVLDDSRFIFASQQGAERPQTIANILIYYFFSFKVFLRNGFDLVFHISACNKHSLFDTSTIVLSVAQHSSSKLLFRLWSWSLTSYRAFVCVASSVLFWRRIFRVTVEL